MKILVKNIFTTIVALTLLFSSAGFQVYKHICASHNFSAVSLLETPSCEKDHQLVQEIDDCCKIEEEIIQSNCCDSEPIAKSELIIITSQEVTCCTSSVESNLLESSLFPPSEKKILIVESITLSDSFTEIEILQSKENLLLQNNDLPPPKFGKQLLHTIHQLKIDTPIC